MELELGEYGTLQGVTIKNRVTITMSPYSSVIGCRFERGVVLKTTKTPGRIPLFWQNYIIGHLTCKKTRVQIRENVLKRGSIRG